VNIRRALVVLLGLLIAVYGVGQSKKKKKGDEEPVTQTLPLLKDPPAAVPAETAHLVFHISPLSGKGLLSPQIREALRALFNENHGAPIVKLRAFVAGSGDLRRVQTLVSEVFTDHKMNLPALSTIQVGALPLDGAQVVLESIAVDRKAMNPSGLAFFAGQQAKDVRQSMKQLQAAASAAGVKPGEVLRVTCFLSSVDDVPTARSEMGQAFPNAAANYVQLQRLSVEPLAECEAVGRLDAAPASPVVFVNPPGLTQNPNYSQIALVNAPKVVLSGTQMVFGEQDADVDLGFERLQKALEPLGVTYKSVFWSSTYPLTKTVADKVRARRFNFLDRSRPPASTFLLFEGLPSLDASVAFEVMAVQM
jgi:enamine deaminase RidA (YjgF/YER057c/UK114 family)